MKQFGAAALTMNASSFYVQVRDLDMFLDSLSGSFAAGRKDGEGFGDWVARSGLEAVRQQQQALRAALEAAASPSEADPSSNGRALVGSASS